MKNKKIVITANTCWYIYNFRKNTINELVKIGYEVIVLAPEDEYTRKLTGLGCHFHHINIDRGGTNPIKDFKTFLMFYDFYSKKDIAVVLNFTPKNNIYSTIAAKFNHVKVINNIAGLGAVFVRKNILTYIVKKLYRYSQGKADFVFFQNEDDKNIFKEANIITADSDVLPGSGVDLDRFCVSEAPDNGEVVFALAGRMLIDKGVIEYSEAARYLKSQYQDKVRFLLAGGIDSYSARAVSIEKINSWVNEGSIEYLGQIDNVESLVKGVDCVVLPSFYREGVPKSLLEAAAMGKPIITTDNVGCRETVEHKVNGFICEPRSSGDLILKMEKMINLTHNERVAMGLKGRELAVNKFDEKIVIHKYLKAIEKVTSEDR